MKVQELAFFALADSKIMKKKECERQCKRGKYLVLFSLLIFLSFFLVSLDVASANTYAADLNFFTDKNVYSLNERIELHGHLYLSNFSNGTLVANRTVAANRILNISIVNKASGNISKSYKINTSSDGTFKSKSDFHTTSALITTPSKTGNYYVRVNYTDPNKTKWWTQNEILVVNKTVDRLVVSTDKLSYASQEVIVVTVEAIREVGDSISYTANVSINGTMRDSSKTSLSSFSCITGSNGKCIKKLNASTTSGTYFIELNNFKAFSSFEVGKFNVVLEMRDELGKSIKHTFDDGERASVQVSAITNKSSDTYTFSGFIKSSSGTVVKTINSTVLNSSNSFTNRFTFTLDAINFKAGSYIAKINVSKSGGSTVESLTSFEVRTWDISLDKRDSNSGFDYEYSSFANKTLSFEILPNWRKNGTVIKGVNTTTSINVSIVNKFNNKIRMANATWNASCGKEGCYTFSVKAPATPGSYLVEVTLSYNGNSRTVRKPINVVSASIFAQSTDKSGALQDIFNGKSYAYITLTAKNRTSLVNLTDAKIVSVTFMNGSDYSYSKVNNFSLVNTSNAALEWSWNRTLQRFKLDTPGAGGIYNIVITANNDTSATSAKMIVNPYDVCISTKNTAGGAGGSTGYYYVYQFKNSDTVYFEMRITQANNQVGRASFLNQSNSSNYGMGRACSDKSSTSQVVSNATLTIEEVFNTNNGKTFSLNKSQSGCQADDSKGKYSCTVKSLGNWDAGNYGVKIKIVGPDGQLDYVYGSFESRSFYLYAWSETWRTKPNNNITLKVQMYEAGNNWWGNYGSGGLSGTVSVEKIEYMGSEGDWIWPPIKYDYNVSKINSTSITSGQGTIKLRNSFAPNSKWRTGSYRAILKGTDSGGNVDYGYAWFEIKQWEVYASPVECSGSTCNSVYNLNSKNNVSLYVTINNAGEWGQSGKDLGGLMKISVKKIMDCRKYPCAELNASKYRYTNITIRKSSGWYYSNINKSYIINLSPKSGTWSTGYWQVVLNVNGSETGSGWFNTIAFYVETQPTNKSGDGWKYNIRNNQPMYIKVKSLKSQKSGYYYASYSSADYINTTIDSATLNSWNSGTYKNTQYSYPKDFNVTIKGGGTVINGTKILNLTSKTGNWPSGYYWGELTLKNKKNETATGNVWFQVMAFRVDIANNKPSLDKTDCVNATVRVYDPDWSNNQLLNTTRFNISKITENIWTGYSQSNTNYVNFTPKNISFKGNTSLRVCPNGGKWGSGSWGNYHYLTIRVRDGAGNQQEGWLSFQTAPFNIRWGNVQGGTNVMKTSNVIIPVNITKASGGAKEANLMKIYQWRYDGDYSYQSKREEYVFKVGNCWSNVSSYCLVNGSKNVTIYVSSSGWKEGYNYLQAEWSEYRDTTSTVQDTSGVWFNGVDIYNGYFTNVDHNNVWRYYYGQNESVVIKITAQNKSSNPVKVNVTKVEYSTPSTTCWSDSCRTYNNASYSIVNKANKEINGSGFIRITKPSNNWTKGFMYIRATVTGPLGSARVSNGYMHIKDPTPPIVTITTPKISQNITKKWLYVNWTTNENANCYLYVNNYQNYKSSNCNNWGNSSNSGIVKSCNKTKYNLSGSKYVYDYISSNYRSWTINNTYGWKSESTGLSTGGTTHYYKVNASNYPKQSYGMYVSCNDEEWNPAFAYTAFKLNYTS